MKERNRGLNNQLAITLVLLLAAFLRLWNLGSSAFTFDSAYLSNLAARFLSTGVPPAQGMVSSVGIVNPPLAVYLISLPVLLSRDPRVVTGFVAVANVIAVWECYLLGRRYWGHWQGTLAALLLAVSPWAVYYSRGVGAQELLLPGVILFFALIMRWLVDHKSWAVAGATFTLAALVQIHFATLALAPVLAAVLLASAVASVRDRRGLWPWKPLVVGTVAGALLYLPYLLVEAQNGWPSLHAWSNAPHAASSIHWQTIELALINIGARDIYSLAVPQQYQRFLSSLFPLAYWPDRLEETLVILSSLYLFVRCWRERADRGALARDGQDASPGSLRLRVGQQQLQRTLYAHLQAGRRPLAGQAGLCPGTRTAPPGPL